MFKNKNILISLHIIIFLIIAYSSIINMFPEGYFFSSGDVYQIYDFKNWSKKYNSVIAGDGLGLFNKYHSFNLYYKPFFLIANFFNLDFSQQSSLHQFIFLYFSFLSFYFFCNLTFPSISKSLKFILSICYSYNIIVFSYFWYTWAYTPIKLFYVLLPITFGLFHKYINCEKIEHKIIILLISSPILFILNIPFSNLSYFVFMLIFFNFYFLYDKIFFQKQNFQLLIKNLSFLLLFWFFFIVINLTSLFNFLIYIEHDAIIVGSGWYNKLQWIKDQAAVFPKPFFLFENYQIMRSNMSFFPKLSIIFYLLITYFVLTSKKINKDIIILFSFLLILIFIHNKGQPYLPDKITEEIFANSILYAFRSADKVHTYYPFIILFTILVCLKDTKNNYIKLSIILIVSILSSYPLLTGGIKTKYDLLVAKDKTFLDQEITMLKNVNYDLKNIAKILNSFEDQSNYDVINLPFTGMNSPNWSTYYKNKHVGLDPYDQMFKHRIISLNKESTALMPYYARNWNLAKENENWPLLITKLFSSKYMIFHKDTHDFLVEEGKVQLKKFTNQKAIEKIYSGKDADLYLVKKPFFQEKIYIADSKFVLKDIESLRPLFNKNYFSIYDKKFFFEIDKNITSDGSVISLDQGLNQKLENITSSSPTKYNFKVSNANKSFHLVFNNFFNKGWKLTCSNCDGYKFETQSKMISGYLSGWVVETNKRNLKLKIEYKFENLFKISKYISYLIVFISLCVAIFLLRKKNFLLKGLS